MAKKYRFTKPPKPASRKTEQLVTGCVDKAPEEAEQEDVHVQTAGTLPLTKPGFTTKTVELQQKKIDKTSMLDVLVFTDTHITGLQDEIDDVPLEEWVEKCKAGQQATQDHEDAVIDEVAPDAWFAQFMANEPQSCE